MTRYFAKRFFDGSTIHDNVCFVVEEGQISQIELIDGHADDTDIFLNGLVTAGFIDTQVNGGGGALFNHDTTVEALAKMMQGHCKFGTTAMLPTLITDSHNTMQQAAAAISEAIAGQQAGILGVHFEGPHLSLPKKGIHPSSHVRAISDADLAIFLRKDLGKVMLTIAPETVPVDIVRELADAGVVVSLGHSGATVECALAAIDAGARGFTHLYNAMSGLSAREPGLIAAALTDTRVMSGLIVDLHHVHPYSCKIAYQSIGAERLMLVTDAMAHVGTDIHSIPWLDTNIIRHGDKLTLEDGSLAGSCLDMAGAVRNMSNLLDGQLDSVLNMASRAPAQFLGLENYGELKVGKRADFVLLDEHIQALGCWINGKQVAGHPLMTH